MRHTFAAIASRLLLASKTIAAVLVAVSLSSGAAKAADPRYAAIVIDARTGKIMFSANAESRRYPASLTKMMTLYITFEAMAAGKINKNTLIPFSAQAAAKPPTKLGVKAGRSITVETAIYALVTKSANDAATALGEYFGGSEQGFARMMTAKARRLGMTGTVFRNPSGLPDPGQFTTAHDMARLGIALRTNFPQYYRYFSTTSFTYGRQRMANHNRLLGRIKGVDGIKTGYTRMSGYNLVSSVSDGNRRIVAVVMGGASGASRDRQSADLIRRYLPQASTSGKGEPLVAAAAVQRSVAKIDEAAQDVVAAVDDAPAPKLSRKALRAQALGKQLAAAAPRPKVDVDPVQTASVGGSPWAVQIAASPSKAEATAVLAKSSRQAPSILSAASGYTTTFEKGGVTYYRVRFGGFDTKAEAWKACTGLKKKAIACYAVQN